MLFAIQHESNGRRVDAGPAEVLPQTLAGFAVKRAQHAIPLTCKEKAATGCQHAADQRFFSFDLPEDFTLIFQIKA